MTDDIPDINHLEVGDEARIEYRSERSGNTVERDGTVTEIHASTGDAPFVYVHDEQ